MVESHAVDSQFLAVTYDRFEFTKDMKIENVSLQYHLRNIITRILLSFLSYLSEHPDVIKALTKAEKKQLRLFVSTYLGDITGDKLQELMKELKSLPDKFKEYWSNNVGILEPAINFMLKSFELESIDLPDVKQEEKRLNETYKFQMGVLLELVKKLGFKSIYVLIDRIDETELTGNNPEASYLLIKPIIRDLDLLGLDGYGFKFFLWDKIKPYYKDDARPDRVNEYNLNWNRATLKRVLNERIRAFSADSLNSLTQIANVPDGFLLEDVICLLANGSPRNMIRYCESILATQAERDPLATIIDFAAIDKASVMFAEKLCGELYDDNTIKNMQKIGRELFTISYVAGDVLKVSGQAVRNKINTWINTGAIKQVGTVALAGANKPVNFYCIVDPLLVRLLHRTTPLDDFIGDRWLPCNHCQTENLINIDLYPENNDATCRECARKLI